MGGIVSINCPFKQGKVESFNLKYSIHLQGVFSTNNNIIKELNYLE